MARNHPIGSPRYIRNWNLDKPDVIESGQGHRIPLATRQMSWANDLTCRSGMVLEEPRNVEKFARMPRAAVRSDSKDMMGLEWTVSLRGKSDRGVDKSCLTYVGEHNLVGRKGSGSAVDDPNV